MGDLISPWKPEPDVVIHQALGKACEEASELANILARCLIQGINSSEPVTGKPNLQALFEEIADLDAAVQWLREVLDNGYDQYDGARADRKLAGFHRWQRLLEEDMAAPAPAPNVLPPVVTGQMEIEPDVTAADLGVNAEPPEPDDPREEMRLAAASIRQWIPETLPTNEAGQIHFARALAESAAEAIERYLATTEGSADE